MVMYADLDCDIACSNLFEDQANLLSKSAFPVNCPVSSMHNLARDGLIAVIQGMAKGLAMGLLVSSRTQYTVGLDKNLVGDFLENHDDLCSGMNLYTALQLFLEAFKLPGESQNRVLKAFSESDYGAITTNLKLYHSICKNNIRTTPEQGSDLPEITLGCWNDLMHKSKQKASYIVADSRASIDHDMFATMSGLTIAAISVVLDHAEHEYVYQTCIDGFLAVARISGCHRLGHAMDDLVLSLCKYTTLLNSSSVDEPVSAFGDDIKARMATITVFTIANRYGNNNSTEFFFLLVVSCAADDSQLPAEPGHGEPLINSVTSAYLASVGALGTSSGLMGWLSQLLSLDTEEPRSQPISQQLGAHQRTLQTIQKRHVNGIFTEYYFLQAESLLQLARSLTWDGNTAFFCLELQIATTLNNRDRIVLLWQCVYEHIATIVQSTLMPCALVGKALLPYKENLADELLRSLQLMLKPDVRVADAYCEQITQEVSCLVKASANYIRSQMD
ncbi:hypothetical protein Nepgr_003594 [Nepenthes gracilis]|uniref:Uncharacterized protein n=1 Tax=Nepenthes gracilis TaxID=150966 RepID=A0AAD3XE17_NEPGR|nr:hypothetical protein Nepgr_003594 [Nepenthes gracilis]